MNLHPGNLFTHRRPSRSAFFGGHLTAFIFGVAVGLLLALWWRAAQLSDRMPPYHEANSGIRPESSNP